MCVLFYSSFVCLYVYAYDFKSQVHCGSALRPGASGLPYYCAPLVCVPAVLGELAVWQHNKPKTKNQHSGDFVASRDQRSRSVAIQIDTAELVSQTATLRCCHVLLPATIGLQSISGAQALARRSRAPAHTACLPAVTMLPAAALPPPALSTTAARLVQNKNLRSLGDILGDRE